MIQKEEYLKALDIVEQYHKQLELQIVSRRSFHVSYQVVNGMESTIKTIEVVEKNKSRAIEKAIDLYHSKEIYGAIEL